MNPSRTVLRCLLVFGAVAAFVAPVQAQDKWPGKPVRIVVPYPAGGGNDAVQRQVALGLGERIGRPVIVDNRAGASGTIGTEYVSRQPPDGYTLLSGNASTHGIAPSFYVKLGYDPVKDFTPLTLVYDSQAVLVAHPTVPAKTLPELVRVAKRHPGVLNYASYGNGAWNHLVIELLSSKEGLVMTHIPYKGNSPAMIDLLSGQVGILFDNVINPHPHVRSGRLRAIAVSSTRRSPLFPDTPTFAESGYTGFESMSWVGLFAPAGMPAPLVQQISGELIAVLRTPRMSDFLRAQGGVVAASSPEELGQLVRNDIAKWRKAIQAARLQPEQVR
jgi:tripartite-type tricarboxylate transporter receptor subunit TctC